MERLIYSALIVSAGRGERAGGGLPKQFQLLGGRPMLAWSVARFNEDPDCEEVIIVVAPGMVPQAREALGAIAQQCIWVEGGETRSQSVANGLKLARLENVLVHDAARPLLSQAILVDLKSALRDCEGAAPALPVADALARSAHDGVEPVSREGLYRIQTPQAFRTASLCAAFEASKSQDYPDEVSRARACDIEVALVPGDESNFKVTWPEDFGRAEQILKQTITKSVPLGLFVTGSGYDVHRLAPGTGVFLCGVFIECPLHLVGHSDADAGLHAITDALLGAAGLGDIGEHFPPTDDRWKGADSVMFLEHALSLALAAGVRPVHCDVTLICERPKIGPHKPTMKAKVAETLGLDPARVNIKATTTEKLGFTGRGEGLAAEAVVTCQLES